MVEDSKVVPGGELAAKASSTKKALPKGLVDILTDKSKRRVMIAVLAAATMFDMLGTVLMAPAGAILVQNAAGGPIQVFGESMLNATDPATGATFSSYDAAVAFAAAGGLAAPFTSAAFEEAAVANGWHDQCAGVALDAASGMGPVCAWVNQPKIFARATGGDGPCVLPAHVADIGVEDSCRGLAAWDLGRPSKVLRNT